MENLDLEERDSRFDGLIMSTCARCGTTWIKEKVGQRHPCPVELDSTTEDPEGPGLLETNLQGTDPVGK